MWILAVAVLFGLYELIMWAQWRSDEADRSARLRARDWEDES